MSVTSLGLATRFQAFHKDPLAAVLIVLGKRQAAKNLGLQRLLKLISLKHEIWQELIAEFKANETLHTHLEKTLQGENFGQISGPLAEALYGLCRALTPDVVIETGVAAGVSSAIILQALADNNKGKLLSIDKPNYDAVTFPKIGILGPAPTIIPVERRSGWAVPSYLRSRWTLRLGLSLELLPEVLREVGELDIFFHDSEHTYNNMIWEFKQAWGTLRPGGIIVSHDISWNDAFFDFCKSVKKRKALMHQQYFLDLGIVKKGT